MERLDNTYACPVCKQKVRRHYIAGSYKQTMRVTHEKWCRRWALIVATWPSLGRGRN